MKLNSKNIFFKNKNMRNKKAQVAMEYMHTYGWVLLTMVMLGSAMGYYTIKNSDNIIPTECIFLAGIDCVDVSVEENIVTVVLINEFGFSLNNINFSMAGTCNSTSNTTMGNIYDNPVVFMANTQEEFIFECQNLTNFIVEEKLVFAYSNVENGNNHSKVGSFKFEER